MTGHDIDLARAQMRGVDPDESRFGGVPRARLEPGGHSGRQRVRVEVGDRGDLAQRDPDRSGCRGQSPGSRPARCRRPMPPACGRRWRRMRSRRTDAVSRTAPAVIEALRLPAAPAPKPVIAVSPWIVATSSILTPRASAVSCTTVVSMLLPVEPPAMYTLTLPDGSMRIVAASVRVVAEARGRGLHVGRQSDTQVATAGAGLRLLLAERVVVEHLQGLLERLERARCCRRASRWRSCTAARHRAAGCGAAARPGRCPSAERRCRAAPPGPGTRTATGRGTRSARRCSCTSSSP